MKNDGKEYFFSILDLTTTQKIKTIKSICGSIIKNLSLKYDGYASFLINFCLLHIDNVINGNSNKENIDYSLLNDFKSELFNSFSPDSVLEICIIILVINSPYVKLKLLELMKFIIIPNFYKLLQVKDELLIARNCLLFGFFIDKIFDYSKDSLEFKLCIEFLFSCLFMYEINEAISYEAANAIKDLIYFEDYKDMFYIILEKISPRLITHIKENTNIIFFDILYDIVPFLDGNNYNIEILKQVTSRILKEFKTPQRSKDKDNYNVYINKCFHIIKRLTGGEKFCIENEVSLFFIFRQQLMKF